MNSEINSEINTIKEEDVLTVRNMQETGFIVSFCEKFKSCLRGIDFWPEVNDYFLRSE